MKHFKLFLASFALIGAMNANAQTDVTATYITNADLSSTAGWTEYVSGSFKDYGNGLIGTYNVRFSPATIDDTHLDTEYCFGFECRWSGNYASYNQTTEELPAGVYTLTYDVENVNGATTKASYNNLFYVQVGDNKITDSATEWMNGKSSWTTHTINFTIDEPAAATISLGYGTGSNNFHANNTPALYVSHLKLTYQSLLDGVKALWEEALAEAQAAAENADYAVVTGEERDALNAEIAKAEPTTKEGYEEATAALQQATAAFTAAKDAYSALATAASAEYPILTYADPAKRTALDEACNVTAVSAADAQEKTAAIYTALRAYYESNALAEGVDGAVNMTDQIVNATDPTNTSGWTFTAGNIRTMSNEPYTDADGTNTHSYFDSNSWGSAFSTKFTQDLVLEAGKYILTAKARGNGTTSYQVIANDQSTDISVIGNSGGVFGRGWNDYTVEFEVTEDEIGATIGINVATGSSSNWISFGDFRLVQLSKTEVPIADADDYAALAEAIAAAEAAPLGFDVEEYAPYNNVEALEALTAAKAIDMNVENRKKIVTNATAALTAALWTENEEELNAVYDGDWAITPANTQSGVHEIKGWDNLGVMRLVLKDAETYPGITDASAQAAVFAWGSNNVPYGSTTGYTMPLNEDTYYEFSVKVAGWNGGVGNVTVSILNGEDGLNNYSLGGASKPIQQEGSLVSYKTYFKTGAAGDYILNLYANGNFVFTDVKIVKVVKTDLVLHSTDTAAPEEQFAGTVSTDRILLEGLNTLVLPFETTKEEIGASAVLEYTGTTIEADGLTLNFTEVESLSANVPYAVMMAADATETLSFVNKEVVPAEELIVEDEKFSFVGTYTDIAKGNDVVKSGDYVAGAQAFKKAKGGNRVAAYRAYLKKAEEAPEAKIAFNFDGTIVDGIQAIELLNNLSGDIFNLNGQKLQKAQKGVNIINGKKVLVK